MKEIKLLYKGTTLSTYVDDEDYDKAMKYRWNIKKHQKKELINYYAVHTYKVKGLRGKPGYRRTLRLAHLILGKPEGNMQVDHKNGNGLDNQKHNLRFVTPMQNAWNSCKTTGCSSKYKGVWLEKRSGLYCCDIRCNKKKIYVGRFKNEVDAALAYNKKAVELHGEYARLNEIST